MPAAESLPGITSLGSQADVKELRTELVNGVVWLNFVVVSILYEGAGERAQQLVVCTALIEGLCSIPSTHLTQL